MKGMTDSAIITAIAVIVLVLVVVVFFFAISSPVKNGGGGTSKERCTTNEDCSVNINGQKCIQVYTSTGFEGVKCGCVTSADCDDGFFCDVNQQCKRAG